MCVFRVATTDPIVIDWESSPPLINPRVQSIFPRFTFPSVTTYTKLFLHGAQASQSLSQFLSAHNVMQSRRCNDEHFPSLLSVVLRCSFPSKAHVWVCLYSCGWFCLLILTALARSDSPLLFICMLHFLNSVNRGGHLRRVLENYSRVWPVNHRTSVEPEAILRDSRVKLKINKIPAMATILI